MGIYDTQTLRKYCLEHEGDILDVGYLLKTSFNHIKPGSFRKYVSRLVEEEFLFPIEKGIYSIGKIPESELKLVIFKHYTAMAYGLALDNGLLWQLGILKEMPSSFTIVSNLTNGNRNIRDIYIKECKSMLVGPASGFIMMVNLNTMLRRTTGDLLVPILETFKQFLNNSNTTINAFFAPAFEIFSRQEILSLANCLDKMHISNTVMQEYEHYMELCDYKHS